MPLGKFLPGLGCYEFKTNKFSQIRRVTALKLSLGLQNLTTMSFTIQKFTSILNGKNIYDAIFLKRKIKGSLLHSLNFGAYFNTIFPQTKPPILPLIFSLGYSYSFLFEVTLLQGSPQQSPYYTCLDHHELILSDKFYDSRNIIIYLRSVLLSK